MTLLNIFRTLKQCEHTLSATSANSSHIGETPAGPFIPILHSNVEQTLEDPFLSLGLEAYSPCPSVLKLHR